jgi:pimeloyl-ACP methyl ester carboxylesterase
MKATRGDAVQESQVRVHGLKIHVREVGAGAPVLLINGIGAHTAMWQPLESVLGDGFRLIEFDAPGTGQSDTPLAPMPVWAMARVAAKVLEHTGVEQADVLGYSLGGLVAQQLAVSAPQRVRRLVLAATTPGWGGIPGDPMAMLNVLTPLRYWFPGFYRRTVGSMAGGRARSDPAWVQRQGELRQRHPPSTRGYVVQVMGAGAFLGIRILPRITQPTLVICGDDDPLVPVANSLLIANRVLNGRVVIAPGEGHLLLMDDASAMLGMIRDFFAARSLEGAAVWEEARVVSDEDVGAAVADAPAQIQPLGVISAAVRKLHAVPTGR